MLLQEFRRQLDQLGQVNGKHYTLTVDIPGGNIHSTGSWELREVAKTVDWIDLMASTTTAAGSHDGLQLAVLRVPAEPPVGGGAIQWTWSTAGSVPYFLANGVPANKLVVGIPFYGKEYTGGRPGTGSTSRTARPRTTRRPTTTSSTRGSPTPT